MNLHLIMLFSWWTYFYSIQHLITLVIVSGGGLVCTYAISLWITEVIIRDCRDAVFGPEEDDGVPFPTKPVWFDGTALVDLPPVDNFWAVSPAKGLSKKQDDPRFLVYVGPSVYLILSVLACTKLENLSFECTVFWRNRPNFPIKVFTYTKIWPLVYMLKNEILIWKRCARDL